MSRKPSRVATFAERTKIQGEQVTAKPEDFYTCGCGSVLWLLVTNGDCVCAKCRRAQARISVTELAPVERRT